MFGDRGHECVGSNGVLIDVTVVNVKAGWMLDETHDRPVLAVDVDSRFPGRVHGDSAHSSDLGQRQDVRDGVLVIPDGAKVWKIANHVGILVPPFVIARSTCGLGRTLLSMSLLQNTEIVD